MFKCVIFDLDGVIVDTAKYHYQAWKKLAESLGTTLTHEENEQLKGVSRMDSLQFILDKTDLSLSEEEKKTLATRKNDDYLSLIQDMDESEILPGVSDFITDLKVHDIKIVLGSASKNAKKVLRATGLIDKFDAIVDGNDVINGKPDPEVFLKGAESVGVEPHDCVVIEDAEKGIEAANAAQMFTVGMGEPEALPEADLVLSDLKGMTYNRFVQLVQTHTPSC